jgi:hypothetical protein
MAPLGPAPKQTGRQAVGCDITWTWTCVIALQVIDPSSHQRGGPTKKRKKVIVTQRNVTSWVTCSKRGMTPRQTGRLMVGRNITWTWTWGVSELVAELGFSCKLLLLEASSLAQGRFGNSEEGECLLLETAAKNWLVKTCLWTLLCNSKQ